MTGGEEAKIEAILSACLLLPPLHAATLTCLVRFLSEVANASSMNKMDSKSLAIVFTPSLFPMSENAKKIDPTITNSDLAVKLEIVEIMIKNSNMVRCIFSCQIMKDFLQFDKFFHENR